MFGALITPDRLGHLSAGGWVLAVLAILLVRPVAMLLSLLGTRLSGRERATAAWCGQPEAATRDVAGERTKEAR
ncbi:hypothetical protein GCM10027445_01550 [Amycolatopsis endophytica]|uniref:NhaP-type Na+/H+ and K+/H+ antiporter n=1 Tax=Amycolatopsis endophytica TaxID=860233 RepID=A0A853BAS1_9PSEU|nr:hypothetical protein [Amycolatopsis endophytica]NYI91506.1 NhaP-type Na+/H+ and K+/H+ antiporter [Amycolatopsis endophytica]